MKYMNVDIIAFLEDVMKSNTKNYQSDFEYDKNTIRNCLNNTYQDEKTLLWMSRTNGTYCFREREVFMKDSDANYTWSYYANQSSETIITYAIELKEEAHGMIKGNVYELDYQKHVDFVEKNAIHSYEVEKTFKDGFIHRVAIEKSSVGYYDKFLSEHGSIIHSRSIAEDEDKLKQILYRQKLNREKIKESIQNRIPSLEEKINRFKAIENESNINNNEIDVQYR